MALIVHDWCARATYLSGITLTPVPDEEAAVALASATANMRDMDGAPALDALSRWEPSFRPVVNGARRRPENEPLPIPCLVGTDAARRHGGSIGCRRWGVGLPHGALVRLDDPSDPPDLGVFAPSPAFHWLLRTRGLGFGQALLLGCELCGTYSMAPQGMRRRPGPLTTPGEVADLLASVPDGARHVSTARSAAPHLLDGCASPREAATVLYASLPARRGGYGLPEPQRNHPVALNARARALLPAKRAIYLDLTWPESHLAVEYDSHGHEEGMRPLEDKDRLVAAAHMGFEILPLTPNMADRRERLDAFMEEVADRLGVRQRPLCRSTLERRARLHRELFTPWNLW